MDEKNYLIANKEIIDFHDKIIDFAFFINEQVAKNYKNVHPAPVTGEALWILSADMLALHRAILDLCRNGWSLAISLLLRSMIEMMLAILVITKNSKDSDFFSFKYLHNYNKKLLNNALFSKEEKNSAKKKTEESLNKLNDKETKEKAQKFLKEKFKHYWYLPKYDGPIAILNEFDYDDFVPIYRVLSGAAHGGVVGLSFLKGQIEEVHPNPRKDKISQNLALIFSNRIILDSFGLRGKFERLDINKIYTDLYNEFIEISKT
jgi:hypothetical protein